MLRPHTYAWYDRLSEVQAGYYYPWRSILPLNHGEDSFLSLLQATLNRTDTVVDAGCGSGQFTNEVAKLCRAVTGYDRVASFIEIANRNRPSNATFVVWDSRQNETYRVPAEDHSVDCFISSKGPGNWISDAPRAGRPRAKMMMLIPYYRRPREWDRQLPDDLRQCGPGKEETLGVIRGRLDSIGAQIERLETYETVELFADQAEFRKYLTWGRFGAQYDEDELVRTVEDIFAKYGGPKGLPVDYSRFIWTSSIPER